MHQFTSSDLYRFDLQGYLYIPNAIPTDLLSKLNWTIDRIAIVHPAPTLRIDHMLDREPVCRELLDAIDLSPLFGGNKFRIDHDYAQVLRRGTIARTLHGGGCPFDHSQHYLAKGDRMFNSLIAVVFNLTDVAASDGGFVCIPGSSKAGFDLPEEYRTIDESNPMLQRFDVAAGSSIVFTEALTHSTFPFTGKNERRTLFLKYTPCFVGWSGHIYGFNHPLVKVPSVY